MQRDWTSQIKIGIRRPGDKVPDDSHAILNQYLERTRQVQRSEYPRLPVITYQEAAEKTFSPGMLRDFRDLCKKHPSLAVYLRTLDNVLPYMSDDQQLVYLHDRVRNDLAEILVGAGVHSRTAMKMANAQAISIAKMLELFSEPEQQIAR